ncbi:TVG0181068 [Thermoplasma volcanium GSS1]|uniref:TVG0181068 protein n=1 Tax=Thermoplasma volcanium (strain ATCC 51530 / DSM 4299 / JCM 9571 / NBRC 15438 / GSS1) TaxID=273116 RepID=Q97CC9_THEVO|nr:glyoxalase/bleomycin resistance/dioxygenase family protein [Thermoplasma volcanium]BAB59315.1 TVG0181068 [Thermoplasma volcanium GSS1]
MKVTGIGWLGYEVRTGESDYLKAVDLFKSFFGIEPSEFDRESALFVLPNGDEFEVKNGASGSDNACNREVAGFLVDDIPSGIKRLNNIGVSDIDSLECGSDGSCWQHFRLPDGTEFELKSYSRVKQ